MSKERVKIMVDYGTVRSTVKPEPKVIDEFSVWVAANITEVKEEATSDAETGFEGYEYDLTQYIKDEYIKMIDEKNTSLETQATDIQFALCDVYELIGG
jgi:hypothetical protein